jgi:arylsulfatase A-like enzyme
MKTAATLLFLLAVSLAPFSGHAQEPGALGRRPNIVFILGDDLGPDSLGCYGSKFYQGSTPRIDALAARGVRFTRCYATALCSPTRRQYATGQYPFRNGCLDIDGSGGGRRNDGHPMLTRMLKDAGYTTGKCGKADICPSEPDERLHVWGYWGKEGAFENGEIGPGS